MNSAIPYTASHPKVAWRIAFFVGLLPVALAIIVRLKLKEPEDWIRKKDIIVPTGSRWERFIQVI